MVEKNQILISYYREGESKSSISARLKISRATVRQYIKEHELVYGKEKAKEMLEKGISSKPSYNISNRYRLKLTQELEIKIKEYLDENRKKRINGQHKQQLKKIDIFELLKREGYTIGYSSVCNYIRAQSESESYIKQIYSPGHTCEFDWGEVKIFIEGKLQTLNLAVFTCAYSNYRWAKLFYRQDTLAFSQSHIDYFDSICGVPRQMVYDNMRVVIKKFTGHSEKEATDGLLELSNYYKFGFRFCNVRRGNEKGHVERSVEFIRRKTFARKDNFSGILQANKYLEETVNTLNKQPQQLTNGQTSDELFLQEKEYLYPTNIPYKCFEIANSKADKYSTITVYGNRYSVPEFLSLKLINIRIFAEKIDTYYNNQFLSSHARSYGAHVWILDINHYLTTLFRKPGALKSSLAFDQTDIKIKTIYQEYFIGCEKEFIELLKYCKDKNTAENEPEKAISELKKISPLDINKDKIIIMIEKSISSEKKENTVGDIHQYSRELLKELASIYN